MFKEEPGRGYDRFFCDAFCYEFDVFDSLQYNLPYNALMTYSTVYAPNLRRSSGPRKRDSCYEPFEMSWCDDVKYTAPRI